MNSHNVVAASKHLGYNGLVLLSALFGASPRVSAQSSDMADSPSIYLEQEVSHDPGTKHLGSYSVATINFDDNSIVFRRNLNAGTSDEDDTTVGFRLSSNNKFKINNSFLVDNGGDTKYRLEGKVNSLTNLGFVNGHSVSDNELDGSSDNYWSGYGSIGKRGNRIGGGLSVTKDNPSHEHSLYANITAHDVPGLGEIILSSGIQPRTDNVFYGFMLPNVSGKLGTEGYLLNGPDGKPQEYMLALVFGNNEMNSSDHIGRYGTVQRLADADGENEIISESNILFPYPPYIQDRGELGLQIMGTDLSHNPILEATYNPDLAGNWVGVVYDQGKKDSKLALEGGFQFGNNILLVYSTDFQSEHLVRVEAEIPFNPVPSPVFPSPK